MKVLTFGILMAFALSSFAMTYFLKTEWVEKGDRFCKYDNGTVLNVGYNLCPLTI